MDILSHRLRSQPLEGSGEPTPLLLWLCACKSGLCTESFLCAWWHHCRCRLIYSLGRQPFLVSLAALRAMSTMTVVGLSGCSLEGVKLCNDAGQTSGCTTHDSVWQFHVLGVHINVEAAGCAGLANMENKFWLACHKAMYGPEDRCCIQACKRVFDLYMHSMHSMSPSMCNRISLLPEMSW